MTRCPSCSSTAPQGWWTKHDPYPLLGISAWRSARVAEHDGHQRRCLENSSTSLTGLCPPTVSTLSPRAFRPAGPGVVVRRARTTSLIDRCRATGFCARFQYDVARKRHVGHIFVCAMNVLFPISGRGGSGEGRTMLRSRNSPIRSGLCEGDFGVRWACLRWVIG